MIEDKEIKEKLKELFRIYIEEQGYMREHDEGLKTFNMIVREFKGMIPRHTVIRMLRNEFPDVSEQMATKRKKRKYY